MKPMIGDNSHKLTDRQADALWGGHIRIIRAIDQQRKELAKKRKQAIKDAKNDLGSVAVLEATLKIMDDGDGVLAKHKVTHDALVRSGMIHVGKGDLLDRVDHEQETYARGKFAGLAGADPVSGFSGGSVDDQTWLSGWKEGQAIVRDEFEDAMKKRALARGQSPDTDEEPEDPFKIGGDE